MDGQILLGAADSLRAAKGLGPSPRLNELFEFLVARSIAGAPPKEIEIALEVFGKGSGFDIINDASVRVYVHRLRKKLEDYYRVGGEAVRIVIPRGEYRVVAVEQRTIDVEPPGPPGRICNGLRVKAGWTLILAACVAGLLLCGWWIAYGRDPYALVTRSGLWSGFLDGSRPTVIVVGDYYIFGEASDTISVTRLVRDFQINSRADLDNYLMSNPSMEGRYVDLDLHYLPTGAASAMSDILPIVRDHKSGRPRIVPSSQLSPTMLRDADILYIGYFSGLRILNKAVFGPSRFTVGPRFDDLTDKRTGKHYATDWASISEGQTPERDLSYVAALKGPGDGRIVIIAGTRDAGLIRAAKIAADAGRLTQLDRLASGSSSLEGLYQVDTLGNVDFDGRLIAAGATPTALGRR